jgi:hypothetical protein
MSTIAPESHSQALMPADPTVVAGSCSVAAARKRCRGRTFAACSDRPVVSASATPASWPGSSTAYTATSDVDSVCAMAPKSSALPASYGTHTRATAGFSGTERACRSGESPASARSASTGFAMRSTSETSPPSSTTRRTPGSELSPYAKKSSFRPISSSGRPSTTTEWRIATAWAEVMRLSA